VSDNTGRSCVAGDELMRAPLNEIILTRLRENGNCCRRKMLASDRQKTTIRTKLERAVFALATRLGLTDYLHLPILIG
jgi:hypothetical protein